MDTALELALLPAFPTALAADVRAVVQTLPESRLQPAGSFTAWIQGEHITIPYRLYNPVPADDLSGLPAVQAKVLHCLYTRHHDGHIRQRHLSQISDATDPWIVPFVVQLIGEYVLDIMITIKRGLTDIDQPGTPHHQAYGRFIAANPDFLFLTSQRVASYWNCYYRNRFPTPPTPAASSSTH
ncbi:hypothetical protein ACFOY2_26560 [Nonomuraea purpurea]|uniref:Uncharacterized protein n=1 Tax=Nonomuraea purpurea TaxID=1849276 RepID=A0ABV8GA20_9ACTN